MADYTIKTRVEAGLHPLVLNSSGNLRPPLAPLLDEFTGHYTGVNVVYAGRDTAAIMRQLNIQFADTKPNEYNWVVDQQGMIWEFAGDRMSAHSLGNNEVAIGCLILVGIGEKPTKECILAFRQLRYDLIQRGRLKPTAKTIKHKDMGTTKTQCPGYAVEAVWSEFLEPWTPAPPLPPTQPTPSKDDDMKPICIKWDITSAAIAHSDLMTYWTYFENGQQYYTAVASGMFVQDMRGQPAGSAGIPFLLDRTLWPNLVERRQRDYKDANGLWVLPVTVGHSDTTN